MIIPLDIMLLQPY